MFCTIDVYVNSNCIYLFTLQLVACVRVLLLFNLVLSRVSVPVSGACIAGSSTKDMWPLSTACICIKRQRLYEFMWKHRSQLQQKRIGRWQLASPTFSSSSLSLLINQFLLLLSCVAFAGGAREPHDPYPAIDLILYRSNQPGPPLKPMEGDQECMDQYHRI